MSNNKVLYIGGFELPDKNAAAQRVVGIAKSLRELDYEVIFINSIKKGYSGKPLIKSYFGFKTLEYSRENELDYLCSAITVLNHIKKVNPSIVIAYNYPAFALNRINRYCKKHGIKCIADATEWYDAKGGNIVHRMIKKIDTEFRMRYVHKQLSGVIAISRYLYDYYKKSVKTVMIPPTVDITDSKWNIPVEKDPGVKTFVYAGSPSATKEKLDVIVATIDELSKTLSVRLNVVGITKDQFINMYSWKSNISDSIKFYGRVDHNEAIRIIRSSDWSIILRENNLVVKAGFPTKLVESISCGVPVLINHFSNIDNYLELYDCIFTGLDNLKDNLIKACNSYYVPNIKIFDYRMFTKTIGLFLLE